MDRQVLREKRCPTSCVAPDRPAVFATEEFFFGTIRNDHTRRAYLQAVNQFLAWADARGLELVRIAPRDVGMYLTGLGKTTSIATRKQHLSALRHFFDGMVTRHAIMLNPALSVRGERYAASFELSGTLYTYRLSGFPNYLQLGLYKKECRLEDVQS